jgi:hypothetical protein
MPEGRRKAVDVFVGEFDCLGVCAAEGWQVIRLDKVNVK